jgi:hypothetical protein
MPLFASTYYSLEIDSAEVGGAAARALIHDFGPTPLRAALVFATMNHDHSSLLDAMRAELPKDTLLVGCSTQGVVGNDSLSEDGMILGAMGFGGEALQVASAAVREVQTDSVEKGRGLARKLKDDLGREPGVVLVFYDPLAGLDVESMIAGMRTVLTCPIAGAGAGQPWGTPLETAQFFDTEVFNHGALALALAGPFTTEIGLCHGTEASGIGSVVTKAHGNQILEIDGRPAVDIWREVTGADETALLHQSHFAIWAVGVERTAVVDGRTATDRVIRGAFGFDHKTGAMLLQAAIPEGTKIMLHHRTIEKVLNGTKAMAQEMKSRLAGRRPWAVLGFECAARTYPFLGPSNMLQEHHDLRQAVAPDSPWLGMMAWGEIGPCLGQTMFHNYSYPVITLLPDLG